MSLTKVRCCSPGQHTTSCELFLAVADAYGKAREAADAARRVQTMWPSQTEYMIDRLELIARIAETVPDGLAGLWRSLGNEVES